MYAILFIKESNELIQISKKMSKHTLNGRKKKAIKTSGFRARLATKNGRKVLKNRRKKGRWKLTISS